MLTEIALAVAVVLLIVAGVWVAVLLRGRAALVAERSEAQDKWAAADGQLRRLETDIQLARHEAEAVAPLQAEQQKLRQENLDLIRQVERFGQERQSLIDLRQKLDDTLAGVATRSLKESGEQFLALAKKTFEKEQGDAAASLEQRKTAIKQMLKPIRETLDKHAKAVEEVERQRSKDKGSLAAQLTNLADAQQRLGQQTTALTTALKGSASARGRWGEIAARRIIELAGMVNYCDFSEQVTFWKGDEKQKPDFVINLPSDRQIIMDSKFTGQSYLEACEATDPQERQALMVQHVRAIENVVKGLASKNYTDALPSGVDFVVMFIPGESFLGAAVQQRPELLEWAMNRNVVLATPTTLIALLKSIELGWREVKQSQNAKAISELGKELHERIGVVADYADKLGTHLGRAINSYNDLSKSMESRVFVTARKFREMGADSAKEIPAPGEAKRIETMPHEMSRPESD
jgi:DNA recombination protein RmuC